MTKEQWQAAWILCETAPDMDPGAREDYIRGATVDPDVESQVLAVLEELAFEADFPAQPDHRESGTVGRYTLLERIGQCGMGQVYSAQDTELDRKVALKFLPPGFRCELALPFLIVSIASIPRSVRQAVGSDPYPKRARFVVSRFCDPARQHYLRICVRRNRQRQRVPSCFRS